MGFFSGIFGLGTTVSSIKLPTKQLQTPDIAPATHDYTDSVTLTGQVEDSLQTDLATLEANVGELDSVIDTGDKPIKPGAKSVTPTDDGSVPETTAPVGDTVKVAPVPGTDQTAPPTGDTHSQDLRNHAGVLAGSKREINVDRTTKSTTGHIYYKEKDDVYALKQEKREAEIRARMRESLKDGKATLDWKRFQDLSKQAGDRNSEVYAGLMLVTDADGKFVASDANFTTIGITDPAVIADIRQGVRAQPRDNISTADVAQYMTKNPKKFENDPGLFQAFATQTFAKQGNWEAARAIASYDSKGMNAVEGKQKFLEMVQLIQEFLKAYQNLVTAYYNLRSVPGTGARGRAYPGSAAGC
jgi:hypothetical protein